MKKNFFKTIAIMLVSVMVFTGCASGTKPSGGQQEVILWHGYPAHIAEVMQQMADEYNEANPNVKISPRFVATNDEMLTKVQASLLNNTQPDILWGAPTMTGILQSTGKLVTVMDYVDAEWQSDIPEGLWNAGKFDGTIYSVPVEAGTLILMYNKEMFAAAGITEVPTTWEQLYETAQKLTNNKQKGLALPFQPNERTTWTWLSFLEQNGGTLLNEDYSALGFDRDTLVETLTYYTKFVTEGYSPSTVGQDPFANKEVAMTIGTTGSANAYINTYNIDIGVAMLPGNKELSTGLGSNHYYVFNNNNGAKVDEAMKFIKWMTTGEQNAKWTAAAGYLPASISGKESEFFKTFTETREYLQTAADALTYGYARPAVENYPRMSNAISGVIEKIVYGNLTVEAGADQIIKELEAML